MEVDIYVAGVRLSTEQAGLSQTGFLIGRCSVPENRLL
jgi:hypothetical protein